MSGALHSFRRAELPVGFIEDVYEQSFASWSLKADQRPPLDAASVEALIFKTLHRPDDIDVLGAGRSIKRVLETRPDGFVSPRELEAILRDGHTVRIRDIFRLSPELFDWASGFASALSSATEANLYITPPGPPALKAHQDGHDVFAYQIFGSKEWWISPPSDHDVSLPFESQAASCLAERDDLQSVLLTPGDILYLPRGFIHHAQWRRDISIHMTIRVHPVRWRDLLREAVDSAAFDDVSLRRSVAYLNGSEQSDALAILQAIYQPQQMREAFARALSSKRNDNTLNRESWRTTPLARLAEDLAHEPVEDDTRRLAG